MNKMMHKVFGAAILTAALVCATAASAQTKKYPYVQDGRIIVCREGSNGVKASLIHPNWTKTPAHNEKDATNNRLAAKFEVAASDASSDSKWDDAADKCPPGWRLPTLRELLLISFLQRELTSVNLPSEMTYWSATEYSEFDNFAWAVGINPWASMPVITILASSPVRCVRDL